MSHPYVPPSSEEPVNEPTSQPSAGGPPYAEQAYDPYQSGSWNPPGYSQHPPAPESYPNQGYGQAPDGQDPYVAPGQPAYGQEPHGQGGYDQAAYGQEPYGQGGYDQATYGQAAHGQNPYGQPGYGQQPNGYVPQPYGYGVPVPVRSDYAHWGRRVGAYLIDFIPAYIAGIVFYVGYGIAIAGIASTGSTDLSAGAVPMIIGGVLYIAALGWQIYNRWIIAGRTGQSLGKRVLKISLISEATNGPIGPLNAFLRDLVHILDGFAYVGFLWPLWDEKRQTFADKLMTTAVVEAPTNGQALTNS